MEADRRGFFRIVASTIALLARGPGLARAQERASEIHRSTRNTLLGALGERGRGFGTPPPPFKPYPRFQRLELPAVASEPALALAKAVRDYSPAGGLSATPLSLNELGRILYFTNGVTGRTRAGSRTVHLRAAPSAGALYAGEVYVVAERVRGLPSGLYYYAVRDHQLVEIRPGKLLEEVARGLEQPQAIESAGAAILLTNLFHRYTGRYANRGYRYALIDSGHIGENLRLAAASAGLRQSGPLRFEDDRLNGLLRVDGREEAVCAVHFLGHPGPGAEASGSVRGFVEKHRVHALPEQGPVIQRYHEATKLVPGGPDPSSAIPPQAPSAPSRSALDLARRSRPPTASVEDAIRKRRSAREFRPEPIGLADLGFVLEIAQGHANWQRASGVDLYLAAHRVKGLAPGLYLYEPQGHRLAPVRERDLRRPMIGACLGQKKAGSAAAGFLMVGRLAESAARSGDRSYRDLLIESGAIGQRIYLAAEAAGLAARNLAAFIDDELNGLMGWDGRREAVLHLTMLGHGD